MFNFEEEILLWERMMKINVGVFNVTQIKSIIRNILVKLVKNQKKDGQKGMVIKIINISINQFKNTVGIILNMKFYLKI